MSSFMSGQRVREPQKQAFQLWISGQRFAQDLEGLRKCGIEAVCSVGSDHYSFPAGLAHLYLQCEDSEDQPMGEVCQQAYQFIENQRKKSNVLVHCVAGISRSATVLAYYLMRKYRWTVEQALAALAASRPYIRPNPRFMQELKSAEERLGLRLMRARF